MSVYLSPHSRQMAAHQREIDRKDVREMARELFAADALKALESLAEPSQQNLGQAVNDRRKKLDLILA